MKFVDCRQIVHGFLLWNQLLHASLVTLGHWMGNSNIFKLEESLYKHGFHISKNLYREFSHNGITCGT